MDAERPILAKRVQIPGPEWDAAFGAIGRAMRLTAELNKLSFDDVAKVREIFSELTGRTVDDTFILIPPFYSAYGLDIRVGHRVFINQCCTLYDMGGVDIADDVMIGPNVNIITTGHPLQPSQRRAYIESKPIIIEKNVWIATGATILGGVSWAKTQWSRPEPLSRRMFRRTASWRAFPPRLFVRWRKTPAHNARPPPAAVQIGAVFVQPVIKHHAPHRSSRKRVGFRF
jgi:hypothetical protein